MDILLYAIVTSFIVGTVIVLLLGRFLDSHEMAGIYFKYDVSPLKVVIREEEYTIVQLILRITGCAGGLYIIAGMESRPISFPKDTVESLILIRVCIH